MTALLRNRNAIFAFQKVRLEFLAKSHRHDLTFGLSESCQDVKVNAARLALSTGHEIHTLVVEQIGEVGCVSNTATDSVNCVRNDHIDRPGLNKRAECLEFRTLNISVVTTGNVGEFADDFPAFLVRPAFRQSDNWR